MGHRGRRDHRDRSLRRLRAGLTALPGVRHHGRRRHRGGPAGFRGSTRMRNNPLITLGRLGQSPWYDYITRELITSGKLARLIAEDGLRGMTSNPTIFEKAISGSADYDDDIRHLASLGHSPQEIFEALSVA